MNNATKRSIGYFLALYLGSVALFFGAILYIYYQKESQKSALETHNMLDIERNYIESVLKTAHIERKKAIIKTKLGVQLYDIDGGILGSFGEIKEGDKIETYAFEPHYMGVAKIALFASNNTRGPLKIELAALFFFGMLFFGMVGFLLSKIILKPINSAYQRLDEFVQDVTHELNTPITVISMGLKLLSFELGSSSKQLARMEIGVKTLSKIYEELLYLKFKSPKKDIQKLEIDKLIVERIEYFRVFCEIKNIELTCNLAPKSLLVAKDDFVRVFDNLLQNSIKYTGEHGKIEVALTNEALCIKDNGIGIDESKKELILKRFERADGGYIQGLGIGLSLVKNICEMYSYKIEIESKKGEGTTVCVRF